MLYQVVETDNFDGDYPDEKFVGPAVRSKEAVEAIAEACNAAQKEQCGNGEPDRYYVVKQLPYKLQPGFEP